MFVRLVCAQTAGGDPAENRAVSPLCLSLCHIMKIHAGMPMESDIETIGSTTNTNANEK
jgi:hypothetical protein